MTTTDLPRTVVAPLVYPERDGQPMADNTEQFRWIALVKENLESLFAGQPDVFVAGDLLWYPVEGRPDIRRAPDALVAFGRPAGYRGAYLQWKEGGVAPQVVFEILSPSNTEEEMREKLAFYERYGVEECYVYDPERYVVTGYLREREQLREIMPMNGWVSPRLGISFDTSAGELVLRYPDGQPFLDFVTERARRQAAEAQIALEQHARVEAEARAARLAARLRALGLDPEDD